MRAVDVSLWEAVLPPEVLPLPEELARVDALLDAVMANLRIDRPVRVAGGPGRTGSWRTRPTPRSRSAPRCVPAGSRPRSPARPTRSPAAPTGAARVGGHRRSTRRPTRPATSSSAPSTSSARPEPSRPDTTKGSSSTAAPLTSPRSGSGCETRPKRIHGTRPMLSARVLTWNLEEIGSSPWYLGRLVPVPDARYWA